MMPGSTVDEVVFLRCTLHMTPCTGLACKSKKMKVGSPGCLKMSDPQSEHYPASRKWRGKESLPVLIPFHGGKDARSAWSSRRTWTHTLEIVW